MQLAQKRDHLHFHIVYLRAVALVATFLVGCGDDTSATESSREAEPAAHLTPADDAFTQPVVALHTEPPEGSHCIQELPKLVEMYWVDVPAAEDMLLAPNNLRLRVYNTSGQPLDVELAARLDGGGQDDRSLDITILSLPPGEDEILTLDLSQAGVDFGSMKFSGRIHVWAALHGLEDGSHHQAISPPLFFHPVGESLAVYSEDTLHALHHNGDFTGLLSLDTEPGIAVDRVIYGGAGHSGIISIQPEVSPED